MKIKSMNHGMRVEKKCIVHEIQIYSDTTAANPRKVEPVLSRAPPKIGNNFPFQRQKSPIELTVTK